MKTTPLPISLIQGDAPGAKRRRNRQLEIVLEQLRHAEFPRDYARFEPYVDALRGKTRDGIKIQESWRFHVAQQSPVPGISKPPLACPAVIFLPLLQSRLATAFANYWKRITIGLPSPKRHLAALEPVPAISAALWQEAKREEDQAFIKLREELDGTAAYHQFLKAILSKKSANSPSRKAKAVRSGGNTVDYKQSFPKIRIWSQPMTQAEYVVATGCPRKTIYRFLKKISAKPSGRSKSTVAGKYQPEVNLKVFAQWIDRWIPNDSHAAGLAAATVAFTHSHDPAFEGKIIQATFGPLQRRKLLSPAFADLLDAHDKLYTVQPAIPEQVSPPGLKSLLGQWPI